ncbi:phosphodiester glycosidase family protein [Microbacteriaceae bacterium 4G12]
MKRSIKKFLKVFSLLVLVLFFCATIVLFATPYGHKLRTIAAESILTSQHPQYAKYTFLSKEELKSIDDAIHNPKSKNSDEMLNHSLSKKELEKRKRAPLTITVETVKEKFNDHFYEGKLMTISNPFNVKLVTQQGTQGDEFGEKIHVMAKRDHALAAVNASGFADETGHGGGKTAIGTVIVDGKIINTHKGPDTSSVIAGLTKEGELLTGDYSPNQLLHKGVVSAAGFMPQLIVNGEKMITSGNGGWGYGPRSIMAQKRDGTIMFLVIDGRQTHSIGASLKDCQDLLYEHGAYNAMAMDGGSSATIYAMGDVLNIPSTLSHQSRYLPNCWVVTANPEQKVEVTIDGKEADQEKIAKISGLSSVAANE